MRLWRQRAKTATQIYDKLTKIPHAILETLPTLPHAASRLKKDKDRRDSDRRDREEGLTTAMLGLPERTITPPEDSTEPTPLPPDEVEYLARRLTGIKQTLRRTTLRGYRSYPPNTLPTPVTPPRVFRSTAFERILMRLIRQKRAINLLDITSTVVSLPPKTPAPPHRNTHQAGDCQGA